MDSKLFSQLNPGPRLIKQPAALPSSTPEPKDDTIRLSHLGELGQGQIGQVVGRGQAGGDNDQGLPVAHLLPIEVGWGRGTA